MLDLFQSSDVDLALSEVHRRLLRYSSFMPFLAVVVRILELQEAMGIIDVPWYAQWIINVYYILLVMLDPVEKPAIMKFLEMGYLTSTLDIARIYQVVIEAQYWGMQMFVEKERLTMERFCELLDVCVMVYYREIWYAMIELKNGLHFMICMMIDPEVCRSIKEWKATLSSYLPYVFQELQDIY